MSPFCVKSCCAYNFEWGRDVGDEITKEVPLRPLTSLKWPYVPDESAYPDPLKRDDPKSLQTAQYEAIGSRNLHLSHLTVSNLTRTGCELEKRHRARSVGS